jgi:hypothetical protein
MGEKSKKWPKYAFFGQKRPNFGKNSSSPEF